MVNPVLFGAIPILWEVMSPPHAIPKTAFTSLSCFENREHVGTFGSRVRRPVEAQSQRMAHVSLLGWGHARR